MNWIVVVWTVLFAWSSLRASQIMGRGVRGVRSVARTGQNGDLRMASILVIVSAGRSLVITLLCFAVGVLAILFPQPAQERSAVGWVAVYALLAVGLVWVVSLEYENRALGRRS